MTAPTPPPPLPLPELPPATADTTTDPILAAHRLLTRLADLDAEMATLERETSALPHLLAQLPHHPILWLLIGRTGIDHPGGHGMTSGQQVVTVTRTNVRLLIGVALLALILGIVLGSAGVLVLT